VESQAVAEDDHMSETIKGLLQLFIDAMIALSELGNSNE